MTIWNVDAAHSNVGFSVRHMMISNVKGNFTDIEGTVEGDPNNLADAKINFKINVDSIDSNNEDRDNHLRSEDFFEVETYPDIIFTSTNIVETKENEFDVIGDLTVKDHTKETTFKLTKTGEAQNPWGVNVVAFEGDTTISRKEFGLTWNELLETGGVMVGDDIKINLEVQVNPAE